MAGTVATASAAASRKGMLSTMSRWGTMAYDGARHIYHGFRLFGRNTKLATRIMMRVQKGHAITRRERLLLESATMDLLRLVPFSVFIIVPFGELLLPIAVKMNPNLIPSTFETKAQGRNKAFAIEMMRVKARTKLIEHATSQIVAQAGNTPKQNDILRRATCGDKIGRKDIREMARHFNTLAPLGWDRLSQQPRVMKNMAKATGAYKTWHGLLPVTYMGGPLRRAVQAQMDKLKRDDDQLRKEGLAMLTRDELEAANHQRGLRWVDSDAALIKQLSDWIELGEDENVPPHTLIFLRPTYHSLRESMTLLPADTREKLMHANRGELPPHVAESLEELIAKVEKHGDDELDSDRTTPDDIAAKVEQTDQETESLGSDLLPSEKVISAMRAELRKMEYERVYDDLSLMHGEVTVRHFTKMMSSVTRSSSHEISNVFDALDFPDQAKTMSLKTFKGLWNRLAEADPPAVAKDVADAKVATASSASSSSSSSSSSSPNTKE